MSTENSSSTNSYLTFKLGKEIFAVNVSKVLEILEIQSITKVPKSPSYMRGVLNLRGNVLPVIETRTKFGMERVEDTVDTCIMVLNINMDGEQLVIGALVDSVQEVVEFTHDKILPPPSIGNKYKSEFIQGMVKSDEIFIMALDIDKVFSSSELLVVKEAGEAVAS